MYKIQNAKNYRRNSHGVKITTISPNSILLNHVVIDLPIMLTNEQIIYALKTVNKESLDNLTFCDLIELYPLFS